MSASKSYASAITEYHHKSVDAPYLPVLSDEAQSELDEAAQLSAEIEMDKQFQVGEI